MATHAEAIAGALAESGVEFAFGVPGGEVLALIDACRRAGVRFVLTGHETSAAMMAQVLGQIRGVPAVCLGTLGPGATNLVTGVANAYLDRAPLLAFTAQIPGAAMATMTHQRLDINQLFAPVTKRSVLLAAEGDSGQAVREAVRLALTPRPGPVHLALPSDVALQECRTRPIDALPAAASAAGDRLPEIAARVKASRRPLVLIGLGAEPGSAAAVGELVDGLKAPFLVTPKVKGILAEDHPGFLGVASGMAIDGEILETLRAADLVLGIGFDPVEADKTWFAGLPVAALDSAPMSAGDYRPLEAVGDIAALCRELAAGLEPRPWPAELLAARRQAARRRAGDGLSPLGWVEELRSVFPDDGLVTCDVGAHKLLMGQFWRARRPGTFFMSNGLSGMGFGLPAAAGAQLACPEKAVLAVVGDGGMLMMLHDLAVVRELNLPLVVVVFSDSSLSLIRVSQQRKGLPTYGVDFRAPDFAAIARAFGLRGERVESPAALRREVGRALNERVPVVLDIPVDNTEYYDLA